MSLLGDIVCDPDTYRELLKKFGPKYVKDIKILKPYISAYQKYNLVKLLEELKNDRKRIEKEE